MGQVGATGTSGSYLYGTPKTIAADSIGTTSPINVGTVNPDLTNSNTQVAGATTFQEGVQSKIDAANAIEAANQTPEAIAAKSLTTELSSLYGQTAGQAQALATEEASRGLPGMETQLASTNSQIQTALAEYNELRAQYEATSIDNRGKPITMNRIVGNEAQIQFAKASALNSKAAEIGLYQAQALGLQGQIEAAQKAAQKAVNLKYAPILEQIQIKTAQLDLLEGTLNKQEQIRADALRQQYAEQQQTLSEQKDAEQQRISFALNAMQDYRDAGISINDSYEQIQMKIQAAPSYQENPTGEKLDTQVVNLGGKSTLINTQTGEVIKVLGTAGTGTSGGSGGGFTPTETRKLEQAGLTSAPRQEQLDFLYGEGADTSGEDVSFYADSILSGNTTFIEDGQVKWSSVPADLRAEVQDEVARRQAAETEDQSSEGSAFTDLLDAGKQLFSDPVGTFFKIF
jgi:predicted RNA-binding protein with EMAP domain